MTLSRKGPEDDVRAAKHVRAKAEEALSSITDIRSQMRALAEVTEQLREHTLAARDAIMAANELPKQSDLQPARVSVQAAKAGGNGGGLTVVDREIRRLVEHSRQAVVKVCAILTEGQKSRRTAALGMASRVQEQARYLQELALALEQFRRGKAKE